MVPKTTDRQVEVEAVNRRVDLIMARHDVVALAKSLSLTQATRYAFPGWLPQLAGIFNDETGQSR